jgi:uncharacterized protein (TIRG00374 family)
MTGSNWKKQSLIIVGAILGIFLLIKVFSDIPVRDILDLLIHAKPGALWLFVGASFLIMVVHSFRWKLIIKAQTRKSISLWKLFQYHTAGFGISFITPGAKVGGEPVRASMLKRHGIDFNKAISTVAIDKIIDASVMSIFFSFAMIVVIATLPLSKTLLYTFLSFAIVLTSVVTYVYIQLFREKKVLCKLFRFFKLQKISFLKKQEKKLIQFEDTIIRFHKTKRRALYISFILSGIAWFLMFLEYQAVLMLFGLSNVGVIGIFLIIAFMGVAYLFPVPLALGFLEAGQITVFKTLGLPVAAGLGLAMIIRFRDLLWTCFAGIFISIHGLSLKKLFKKTIKESKIELLDDVDEFKEMEKDFSQDI